MEEKKVGSNKRMWNLFQPGSSFSFKLTDVEGER